MAAKEPWLSALDLGEVQRTLLIPLYGRAEETRKGTGLISDPKAVEIVQQLLVDLTPMRNKLSLRGAVVRTLCYDELLADLLRQQPQATVVELGCGLNTRRSRMGLNQTRWFNLDMPDVHNLWKKFFSPSSGEEFLPYSAFDPAWVDHVKQNSTGPYIFVSEASTLYFSAEENRKLFTLLADHFPGCHYIFDTTTGYFHQRQERHDLLRMFKARIQWQVDHPREIAAWDSRFQPVRALNFFKDSPEHLRTKVPLRTRLFVALVGLLRPMAVEQYQLNVFRLGEPEEERPK